jgi:hypothetical protein
MTDVSTTTVQPVIPVPTIFLPLYRKTEVGMALVAAVDDLIAEGKLDDAAGLEVSFDIDRVVHKRKNLRRF